MVGVQSRKKKGGKRGRSQRRPEGLANRRLVSQQNKDLDGRGVVTKKGGGVKVEGQGRGEKAIALSQFREKKKHLEETGRRGRESLTQIGGLIS